LDPGEAASVGGEEGPEVEAQGEDPPVADQQQERGCLQGRKDQHKLWMMMPMTMTMKAGNSGSNLGEIASLAAMFGDIFDETHEQAQETKKPQRNEMVHCWRLETAFW
jgi:hypothetical protein